MGKLGCGCGAGVGTSMVVTIILAWQKYNHLSNIKKICLINSVIFFFYYSRKESNLVLKTYTAHQLLALNSSDKIKWHPLIIHKEIHTNNFI
jgi:hypothetical protein